MFGGKKQIGLDIKLEKKKLVSEFFQQQWEVEGKFP